MTCAACHAALPTGARFCPSCGTPCAPAEPAARGEERKVVTVLFCDLVGSTALSGVLDPETLRAVTLRYFELMRQRIEAHGGTLEKFIGDAVMAVFGVPTVREDDARRALAAALDMLAALDRLNADLDTALGVRLNVRIGVNTGRVVTGSDASARQALVSGETVNIAARLEQNAGPGRILIGPQTLLAAGPTVRAESVGPLRLKGKEEPVTAYRLLGLGGDEPEQLRRFDVPFVGRRGELAALDAALERAASGGGARALLVHGEAGQGKTRLVREWLRRRAVGGPAGGAPAAAVHGAGRCRRYSEQGTLRPLADAVAQVVAAQPPPDEAADALALLGDGLLRDGTPSPSVDDTCAALVQVLASVAERRPVVLVLDDCQWAAPALLGLADRLVRDLGRAAVLVLRLARPELLDVLPPAASDAAVSLRGLTDVEALRLAAALTRSAEPDRHGPPAGLLERAGGNPLHLEQLLAALDDDGGASGPLPPTVQALLGARIDALAPAERLVLDLCAVVGGDLHPDELARLAEQPEPLVTATLHALARRRLVEPAPATGPAPVFRFTSGLVHEVAYQSMSKRARARRHEEAAGLASVRAAGDGAVGTHLERAHRYRRDLGTADAATERIRREAAAALGRAGAQALARSDLSWADDLLGRAVALHHPDEPAAGPAARRLGETRLALGRADEGRELLARAAAADHDPVEAAHARLGLAVADPAAGAGSTAEAARAALPVFEAAGDGLGQARACLRLGQHLQAEGRHGDADRLLTRALAHAAAVDAEPERAAALGAIGVSLWRGPQPLAQAADRCRRLLAEHGHRRRTVQVTLNCPLAVMLALRCRWDEAEDRLAEAERRAGELGFAEARVFLPLFAGMVDVLAGRADRALRSLDAAAGAARALGAGGLLDAVTLESARLLLDRGRWEDAEQALADPAGRPRHSPAESVDLDGLGGRIAAARGRAGQAVRLADRAVAVAARTDSPLLKAQAELDRGHALLLLGRAEDAVAAAGEAAACFAAKGHLPGIRWARALARRAGAAPCPDGDTCPDGDRHLDVDSRADGDRHVDVDSRVDRAVAPPSGGAPHVPPRPAARWPAGQEPGGAVPPARAAVNSPGARSRSAPTGPTAEPGRPGQAAGRERPS
jgi:class 3 adenylate cyclase/tetratricopeptide (TPR) repeat protein